MSSRCAVPNQPFGRWNIDLVIAVPLVRDDLNLRLESSCMLSERRVATAAPITAVLAEVCDAQLVPQRGEIEAQRGRLGLLHGFHLGEQAGDALASGIVARALTRRLAVQRGERLIRPGAVWRARIS